ncbi:MAG: M81 family metallopeptidase [Thermomicrobiales bacterium]
MRVERRGRAQSSRRILIGGIAHETNVFSRVPTDLDEFRQRVSITGQEMVAGFSGTRTVVGGFLDGLALLKAMPLPLVYASATPGGIVTREAYAALRQSLLNGIRSAGAADGVLLALHGAMVAEDIADAEADLLRAVRALVGPRVPIVATLDSHANLSTAMVAAADALVAYTTYPHIDTYERGFEASEILGRLLTSGVRATAALVRPPMLVPLPPQCTTDETPMRALLAIAQRERSRAGVLNISVTGGFPYSDVRDAGLRVLVTTVNDEPLARQIANCIAAAAWQRRTQFGAALTPIPDAIARVKRAARFPIILSDSGDNPGAGAPCDGTVLLDALREAGIQDAAIGVICDPETVAHACAAGTGTAITVQLGGKTDDRHGAPVVAAARVVRITDGTFTNTGPMGTGGRTRMGTTALLDLDGIGVIVTEQRVQALDLSLFRSVGIEPTLLRAIVVKSSVHFRAAFAPIAAEIIDVDTPGISSPHLERFAFAHIRRPIWPLDPDVTFETGE